MAKMKAVQVSKANGPFELVERDVPRARAPARFASRSRRAASATATRSCEGGQLSRAHAAAHPRPRDRRPRRRRRRRRTAWKAGDRVGVGWHGGHCFECNACRQGPLHQLREGARSPASASTAATPSTWSCPSEAVARIPDELDAADAGPLLCAGVTTYNALRNSGARAGRHRRGAGHRRPRPPRASSTRRGWASAPSRSRAAPTRRSSRASSARTSTSTRRRSTAAEGLQKLGGADLVLATAPNSEAIASTVDGLKPRGKLLIVAAPFEPLHGLGARAAQRQDDRRLAERQRRSTPRRRWPSARSPASARASRSSSSSRPKRRSRR